MFEAYLDIETTGLSAVYDTITVIGIHIDDSRHGTMTQLVGDNVTRDNLCAALKDVHTIYTYNGSRFDLPFIQAALSIDLGQYRYHHDLMYDCWRRNLYGGFKAVERQLGIYRELTGISGLEAIMLWHQYRNDGDQNALAQL
ncbi:MAG: ribonuclease H-like domain-containing protein, partial [Chloroflexi bacterium]|nr:ribonuclease H-like domain-containing protein [Chloroflexota bacterium]